jgi:hypothetical protein
MNIEQELQRALRRQPAPPDLAARVLARLDGQPETAAGRPSSRFAPWLAAAAAVALLAGGGIRYYEQQQTRREAERAAQELQLALRITSETLATVQERLTAASIDTDSR